MLIGALDSDTEGDRCSDAEQEEQDLLEEALAEFASGAGKVVQAKQAARRRRHAALNAFLHSARPDWTRNDLKAVSEKLSKVNIFSVHKLLYILRGRSKESLNTILKQVGEKAFTKRTMRMLRDQAIFLERVRVLEAVTCAKEAASPPEATTPPEAATPPETASLADDPDDTAQKAQDQLEENLRKLNHGQREEPESDSEGEAEDRMLMLWRKLGPGAFRRDPRPVANAQEPEPEPRRKESNESSPQDSAEENPQEDAQENPQEARLSTCLKADLIACLTAARPDWNRRELRNAVGKLAKIDISSVQDLTHMLRNFGGAHLNARLRAAGGRAFGADTLLALRLCAEAQVDREAQGRLAHRAAAKAPAPTAKVELPEPSQEEDPDSYFLVLSGSRQHQDLAIGARVALRLAQPRHCWMLKRLQAETAPGSPLNFVLVTTRGSGKATSVPGRHALGTLCEVETFSPCKDGAFSVKIVTKESIRLLRTWSAPVPGLPWAEPLFMGAAA